MMMAMMILAMASASGDIATFRAQLEDVAGQPVRLDPRIRIPECPSGYRLVLRATAVDASCPDTEWRLAVPVAGVVSGPAEGALLRRGSAVVVEASGAGFAVRLDGVVEQDAGAGDMVQVRNGRSGQRVLARMGADGRLLMDAR